MPNRPQGDIQSVDSKNRPSGEIPSKIYSAEGEKLLELEKAVGLVFNKVFEEGNKMKGVLEIIEDVQALLEAIILGNVEMAEKYVSKFNRMGGKDLFVEVGKITRKLHDSIREFQENINPR